VENNSDYSINEKIYLQWIEWCHQRQLSFSAISITLVFSLFEITTRFTNLFIVSFLFLMIAVALLLILKTIFNLELDILNYQYKLFQVRNEWNLYYEKSGFKWLYELNNNIIKIKSSRMYMIYILSILIFLMIFVGLILY
jgi:hypothetical protein